MLQPIVTKRTLPHYFCDWVELRCTEGADPEARLTSHALLVIDEDDSVITFRYRFDWADLHARSFAAVHTPHGYKVKG